MFPQFDILGFKIGAYALVAIVGGIFAGILAFFLLKKHRLMIEDGILLTVIAAAGVLIGSHLLYAITNMRYIPLLFKKLTPEQLITVLSAIFGGSVFYGGLFGGLFAAKIGTKLLKLDSNLWFDIFSPIIPLFHGIARVGCFLAGCCYGVESEFGFITNSNTFVPGINGVTRFPVQLLETGCNLILAAIMLVLLRKRENIRLKGNLIYIYLISYGVIRFADEFLRGDEIRGFVGFLSTSQFISVISVSICSVLLIRNISKVNKSKNHADTQPQV